MNQPLVLYGAPLRDALLQQVRQALTTLRKPPVLAIVQVGNLEASAAYIRQKINACAAVGIEAQLIQINPQQGENTLHTTLRALAANPEVTAIIPQLPLPTGWNADAAVNAVPALKDIDGLTEANRQKRLNGDPTALFAATPLGVMRLLQYAGIPIPGTPVAVIGRGRVVGQPLREILHKAGAQVIEINKETPHPQQLSRQAKVVCAAAGVPGLITADWLQPGAAVIDIGLTRHHGKLVGDADAASIEGTAAMRTPSPGGVGPLTVASLLTNVIDAACLQANQPKPDWQIPLYNSNSL